MMFQKNKVNKTAILLVFAWLALGLIDGASMLLSLNFFNFLNNIAIRAVLRVIVIIILNLALTSFVVLIARKNNLSFKDIARSFLKFSGWAFLLLAVIVSAFTLIKNCISPFNTYIDGTEIPIWINIIVVTARMVMPTLILGIIGISVSGGAVISFALLNVSLLDLFLITLIFASLFMKPQSSNQLQDHPTSPQNIS